LIPGDCVTSLALPGERASRWRKALSIAPVAVQTQQALLDEIRQNVCTSGEIPNNLAA